MKTFNIYSVYIVFILLLSGCGNEEEIPVSKADYPFTTCCDTRLSMYKGKGYEVMQSRGWEGDGSIDNQASILPTVYPENLNSIYLMVNNNPSDDSWSNYTSLEFPVYELDGRRVFDICFRAEDSQVWAMNGEESVLITNGIPYKTFFSSSPEIYVSKELCGIYTPGGIQTYEPYGDRLFKSGVHTFMAFGDVIMDMSSYTPVTELSISLTRLTNVVIPRLVICDDLDDKKYEYNLDIKKFTEKLGNPEDWEVRVFLAGNEEAGTSGFPVGFNVINMEEDWNSQGVVTMSRGWHELESGFTHTTTAVAGGHSTIFNGVGFHSTSQPFIFPGAVGHMVDLCFSFHYKGNNPNIKDSTLRYHAYEDLNSGDLRLVTIVVDIDDFVEALTISDTRAGGRVTTSFDLTFGTVSEIPYKIFID